METKASPLLYYRWQFWVALALTLFALDMGLWFRQMERSLPDPTPLRDTAWVQKRFGLDTWTPLAQVPPMVVRVILISEDDTFFHNHGLRLDEVGSAAWDDLLAGRYKRGASSLTQQVVRNAFLSTDKTLGRKIREILLARRADRLVGKRKLLEDYLNLAQWGPKQRGIDWAAHHYFGKAPSQMNAAEGAYLSWLLPDPTHRSVSARDGELSPAARRHVRLMLKRLASEGSLSDGETKVLLETPLKLQGPLSAPVPSPRMAAP